MKHKARTMHHIPPPRVSFAVRHLRSFAAIVKAHRPPEGDSFKLKLIEEDFESMEVFVHTELSGRNTYVTL